VKNYEQMVVEAKLAVEPISDEETKRRAFGAILDSMLQLLWQEHARDATLEAPKKKKE
jgi:hypothetical protein